MFESVICVVSLIALGLAAVSLGGKLTPAAAAFVLALVELLRCLPPR